MAEPIFHIAESAEWTQALVSGSYTCSTRGAALAEVGFIHCSFAEQVETVANFIYADCDEELVLLQADPDAIPAEILVENLDGGAERFPHIYGPLPIGAVTAVHPLARKSGRWRLPHLGL